MEILGIGPLELLFILLIALIVVGPRELGKAARSTGRLLNQIYKSEAWANLSEASRSIRSMPNRLAREAALEELEQVKREMEQGVTEGIDQFRQAERSIADSVDPTTDANQAGRESGEDEQASLADEDGKAEGNTEASPPEED